MNKVDDTNVLNMQHSGFYIFFDNRISPGDETTTENPARCII
jgi:hypothetical protein